MGSCAGKTKRTDNENNRRKRESYWRSFFSSRKKGGTHHRNHYEKNEHTCNDRSSTLCNLPLEILDIILQKSYLHWILNSPTKQRDEEVIRSLISVDVCFHKRITRRRFKKATWRYLKNCYGKTRKGLTIIRNNIKYLMQNIKLSNELISSLLSLNCITPTQSHLIQRQHCDRYKVDELLTVMRSFDEEKLTKCVKCLRRINQKTVARLIENGGGVIKIKVRSCGENYTESMETLQQLYQKIEDLRNEAIPKSHRMKTYISQLSDKGIEILNSQLERQTVVVWIWCHSQAALEYMQRLYKSNQLRDVFFEVIQPFTSKIIDINMNQFKKTVVVCTISLKFTKRIEIRGNEGEVFGLTKLRNEIYVLCASIPRDRNRILIFEDRNSFRLRKQIEIKEIKNPFDIGSSEKDNCVYISDSWEYCLWKITRETDDKYRIIKWLTTRYIQSTLSVSSDGQLLMVDDLSSILWLYGADAERIRSIRLPKDIKNPRHAVKTSTGNFIISHIWGTGERWSEKLWSRSSGREEIMGQNKDQKDKEENKVGKNIKAKEKEKIDMEGNEMEGNKKVYNMHHEKEMKEEDRWAVSELTSDGQMVVRRFIPSNESQEFDDPRYLSLDSDDRVFLFDYLNHKVILLDSDLKWNRILLPAEDEDGEIIRYSRRLCYDDENKQLVVVRRDAINVYSVIRV